MLVRCPACKGQKKVFRIGLIKKDCATCDGTGLVTQQRKDEILKSVADLKNVTDEALQESTVESKQGCCEDGSKLRQKIKKNR